MILLAFDVDGTLETSPPGMIPIGFFQWYRDQMDQVPGMPLWIGVVSPSVAWPKSEFPELDYSGPERETTLRAFASKYPDAKLRLYVSDNKDGELAHRAGFCYIEAAEFAQGLSV